MLSPYDYLAIAIYFSLILAAGVLLRLQSRNTSDYFRAAGVVPWWITGAALFMNFSAWTFTGAAGAVFQSGIFVLALYFSNSFAFLTLLFLSARRFRRMRTITWMEAVHNRFGRGTQQFYTWVKIPLLLAMGGIVLFAVAVFMSSIFHVSIAATLVTCGVLITLVSYFGGAWAVAVNDFIQMVLVLSITAVAAYLALHQPTVGGITGLIHKVPAKYFSWTSVNRPLGFVVSWVIAMTLLNIVTANSVENSQKFLMLRSDRTARRMVIIPVVGMLIAPIIWFIPPLAAVATHTNLHTMFPRLQHPSEGAYVAVCMATMPHGMIGLLVSTIFAATITNLDAVLNQGVGVVVRNFYLPIIRPDADEKSLLRVSKRLTLAFGAILISIGIVISYCKLMALFNLTNLVAGLFILPLSIPMALGFLYLRTPGWSGWSTAVVGLITSVSIYMMRSSILHAMFPQGLSHQETVDATFFLPIFAMLVIASAWFFGTTAFYRKTDPVQRKAIEDLAVNLDTPVPEDIKSAAEHRGPLYRVLGSLSTCYGAVMGLFILIPNPMAGRLAFAFCAAVMLTVGLLLLRSASTGNAALAVAPDI